MRRAALLTLLLSGLWLARREGRTATPALAAAPPVQPASGPGGAAAAHASVRKSGPFLEGGCGYYLYEPDSPAPTTAPLVVFLHGYLGTNPGVYGGWIDHLARRGYTVIYPIYQDNALAAQKFTDNAMAAVQDALHRLSVEPGHPDPQGRWAIIGHSLGCPIGVNLAEMAQSQSLPPPKALMLCNGGDENATVKRLPTLLQNPSRIPDLLMLVIIGDQDRIAGESVGRQVFAQSTAIKSGNKNLLHLRSDEGGTPPLIANHMAPLAPDHAYDQREGAPPQTGEGGLRERLRARLGGEHKDAASGGVGRIDALDFYGYWKWADALMDAAFFGKNREFALGDTPQQRFMGQWSNGTPVKEPEVELGK